MKVSEIGQFALIDKITRLIEETRDSSGAWSHILEGAGDDCAVWRGESGNYLGKVDCQVEGVHFNLDIMPWQDLGWKSLAVNLSDIASMGGIPRYALVSLGIPLDSEVEDVMSLYGGILELAKQTGTAVVGGNISRSLVTFIDVHLVGITGNKAGKYLTRSAARAGDVIAVTGYLGTSAAGYRVLTDELALDKASDLELKKAFQRPEPRLEEGKLLVDSGVEAAIDISDGLLSDLGHICQASRVGANLDLTKLPVSDAVKKAFPDNYYELALAGGEDYQLLFTAPPAIIEKVIGACACPVSVIGEITAENPGKVQVFNESGEPVKISNGGWDHFKSKY